MDNDQDAHSPAELRHAEVRMRGSCRCRDKTTLHRQFELRLELDEKTI
jgi:hypothetical protein